MESHHIQKTNVTVQNSLLQPKYLYISELLNKAMVKINYTGLQYKKTISFRKRFVL